MSEEIDASQVVESDQKNEVETPEERSSGKAARAFRLIISRIPYTKAFSQRIEKVQNQLYDERLEKYNNLKSIDGDVREKLLSEFEYTARQISKADSWIEVIQFYFTGLFFVVLVMLYVAIPPLIPKFFSFSYLTYRSFQGFWSWPLELLLSALTGTLAAVILLLPAIPFSGVKSETDEFINTTRLILFWQAVLLALTCGYLYLLYVGTLAAWPWIFRHRLVFYCIIQAGFCLPLFFALGLPLRYFSGALIGRRQNLYTRAVIIDELLMVLSQMEKSYYAAIWIEFSHRSWLTKRLETVASCVERYFPQHFLTGVLELDRWTTRITSEMANGVREIIKWVVAPNAYTTEDFRARVVKYFTAALAANWGMFDRISAEKLSQRQGMRERIRSIVAALATAAVPVLLLFLVRRLQLVTEPLLTYLTVGAYIWAALSLLSQVDPQYAAKLGALKDVTKTLPFGKKSGDDSGD